MPLYRNKDDSGVQNLPLIYEGDGGKFLIVKENERGAEWKTATIDSILELTNTLNDKAETTHTHLGSDITTSVANATSAAIANKLTVARTITLSGNITGSATFDGNSDITITTTLEPSINIYLQRHQETEIFTPTNDIDYIDVSKKIVDTMKEETSMIVAGAPGCVYSIDFIVINDDLGDLKRISWSGLGMDGLLDNTDSLSITYWTDDV